MKYFFTFLILCIGFSAQSQQAGQFSMYMLNKYQNNAAYAGLDNSLSLTGVFRSQWVGLNGSPIMQNVNAHMPVYFIKGGVGLNINNTTLGAEQHTSMTLSYALVALVQVIRISRHRVCLIFIHQIIHHPEN